MADNSLPISKSKRERLRAAFNHLELIGTDEVKERLDRLLDILETLPSTANPPSYLQKKVGKESTLRELQALQKKTRALLDEMSSIHGAALESLVDSEWLTFPETKVLGIANIFHVTKDNLKLLENAYSKAITLAETFDQYYLDRAGNPTNPQGRPPNQLALGAVKLLAFEYLRLTGNKPTVITNTDTGKASGQFLELVAKVFKALGITTNHEYMARESLNSGNLCTGQN